MHITRPFVGERSYHKWFSARSGICVVHNPRHHAPGVGMWWYMRAAGL
jgi:hypothetical protein